MEYLVTGAAGFIGSHLCRLLAMQGKSVCGIDKFSASYSIDLKRKRIQALLSELNVNVYDIDLNDEIQASRIFEKTSPRTIIHLAAQPGVRLPVGSFDLYLQENINAFLKVFLLGAKHGSEHILYASSSSVYGDTNPTPYSENVTGLSPKSFYGITKLADELMADVLARDLNLRVRGLRFFTVYGPWGRPDMAYFRLVGAALAKVPFRLFGDGSVQRDFTHVNDVVRNVALLASELEKRPRGYSDVVNIGGGRPLSLNYLMQLIEDKSGSRLLPDNAESVAIDSKITMASTEFLDTLIGKIPFTSLEDGVDNLLEWATRVEVLGSLRGWITSTL